MYLCHSVYWAKQFSQQSRDWKEKYPCEKKP